jgi:1-phosphofructokinase
MIITVTLNPSLDRTLIVQQLTRGAVLRADAAREDPGGKGVNVARALAANGEQPCAVFPAGGAIGRALVGALRDGGVDVEPVAIDGATRANVTIAEADGTTTKLNEPGPYLTADDIDAVLEAVENRASTGDWVVIGGSLPPGAEPDVVALLVEAAHRSGAKVALDTSGKALAAGLTATPELVKPNREELAEAVGHDVGTLAEVVSACHELRAAGAAQVLCSLGADGALVIDDVNELLAQAPVSSVRNTVGAGDALLAGYLRSAGRGPEAGLRTGVAWAAAAVATDGTGVPTPDAVDIHAVEVVDLRQSPHTLTKELL